MASNKAVASGQGTKTRPKPTEKSLKNLRKLTVEDARKGGLATAAKLKRNVAFKGLIQEIGRVQAPEEIRKALISLGLPDDQCTMDAAMVYGQYISAMEGDSRSATWIRDTAGQAPVKQYEINDKRDELSLFDRMLQAGQAAIELTQQQQAYITIPVDAPEIIDVELAPEDS